ncbi:hypothetical protein CDAR_175571 [Caerostris darwini]|uniref:Uncharacterized protein n=1 Tax=Caerostris darwini TaxID=1538125 RepID=A0AAV4RXT3_9ARAC|nr:hypothetical protein CDAR_175571 [Caerostris darwini]
MEEKVSGGIREHNNSKITELRFTTHSIPGLLHNASIYELTDFDTVEVHLRSHQSIQKPSVTVETLTTQSFAVKHHASSGDATFEVIRWQGRSESHCQQEVRDLQISEHPWPIAFVSIHELTDFESIEIHLQSHQRS